MGAGGLVGNHISRATGPALPVVFLPERINPAYFLVYLAFFQ